MLRSRSSRSESYNGSRLFLLDDRQGYHFLGNLEVALRSACSSIRRRSSRSRSIASSSSSSSSGVRPT